MKNIRDVVKNLFRKFMGVGEGCDSGRGKGKGGVELEGIGWKKFV